MQKSFRRSSPLYATLLCITNFELTTGPLDEPVVLFQNPRQKMEFTVKLNLRYKFTSCCLCMF